MYYVFSFILMFFIYNTKFDNYLFYTLSLFNPLYIIPSLIYIRSIKNIIAIILGLMNHYFKSKILFIICLILLIIDNPFNLILIPFIFLTIDKRICLINKKFFFFTIYLLSIYLNKNSHFLFLSFIFLIRTYNVKYSYIVSIIFSFITNNLYISIFSLFNPIIYLIYLLPKSYIDITIFDISLYFSIIFYIGIIIINKKICGYTIKDNTNSYKDFLNVLNSRIIEESNYSYKYIESIHNNICKKCININKCINNKEYIIHLKNVISNAYTSYDCIYLNKLRKPYKQAFSYIPIIKVLNDSIGFINNPIEDKFKYLYNILLLIGVDIYKYEIIRGKSDDFLIEINSSNINHLYKYLLKPFNIELIDNKYLTNKTNYKIYHQTFKYSKNNNPLTGDNFIINDSINGMSFILSDGMGSGLSAYNESMNILSLIAKLEYLDIAKRLFIINEICKLKCNSEAYATLDYLYINKSSLDCYLYKMGSSTTYIIRDNDLIKIENQNAPLGFDEKLIKSNIKLIENDIIILTSDGLGDIKNFSNIILKNISNNIQEMLYKIIKDSTFNLNKIIDDISIIIIKIEKK